MRRMLAYIKCNENHSSNKRPYLIISKHERVMKEETDELQSKRFSKFKKPTIKSVTLTPFNEQKQ